MFNCLPIGYVRSAVACKHHVAKQALTTDEAPIPAYIELIQDHHLEMAVLGLDGFDYIWVIFWMGCKTHYKPKVTPPGYGKRVGVLATRSPYRVNPIGLSRVRLIRIKGRRLMIEGCDMLDGTAVLDIKPYLLSDSAPEQALRMGWVDERQASLASQAWQLEFANQLQAELERLSYEDPYLEHSHISRALRWGPVPSKSNRLRYINHNPHHVELALGRWRLELRVDPPKIKAISLRSAFTRLEEINDPSMKKLHAPWIDTTRFKG